MGKDPSIHPTYIFNKLQLVCKGSGAEYGIGSQQYSKVQKADSLLHVLKPIRPNAAIFSPYCRKDTRAKTCIIDAHQLDHE